MLCLRLPIGWRLRLSDQLLLMAHSDSEVPETLGRCPWVTGPSAGRRASFVRSLIGDSGEKSYSDWLDGEPPILAANRSAGN